MTNSDDVGAEQAAAQATRELWAIVHAGAGAVDRSEWFQILKTTLTAKLLPVDPGWRERAKAAGAKLEPEGRCDDASAREIHADDGDDPGASGGRARRPVRRRYVDAHAMNPTVAFVAMLYVGVLSYMASMDAGRPLLDSWHMGGPGARTSLIALLEKEARLSVLYAAQVRAEREGLQ